MNSSLILSVVTFLYGLASFLYIASFIFKPARLNLWGKRVLIVAFAGNTFGIILRWIESHQLGIGHAPLSNMYESLVFFSWTIALIYLFVEKKYRHPAIGAFVGPLAFLAIAYASLSPNIGSRIRPLIPALKSNWLIVHVMTCFLAYAAFAVAFAVSLIYLMKQKRPADEKSRLNLLPDIRILDELTYQMVAFGFLFLTIGIITGAVWANSAWGSYWSWDPKETWSLITWFVYAVLIHARLMRGWDGNRIAYISIAGFLAVLFTYFGVNLLPGLHSYG